MNQATATPATNPATLPTWDAYSAAIWNGTTGSILSRNGIAEQLRTDQASRVAVANDRKSPTSIIGGGYKAEFAKQIALDWLDGQISENQTYLAQGFNDITRSNYDLAADLAHLAAPAVIAASLPDTLRSYGRNIRETEDPNQTIQSLIYVGASTRSLINGELYSVRVTASGPAVWVQGIFGRSKANKFSSLQSFMDHWQRAADRPHQVGQPVTHAPTIAALAECVALVAAQVQEQPQLTPTEPMPTTPKPAGKFPFAVARRNGDRVFLLHQVGKCAVARVYPADKSPAYHLVRFRQHYADFEGLDEAGAAFQALRRLDKAERHRDAETLRAADALDQLTVSRPCLERFCEQHGLDVGRAYPRRELRQAVTDLRLPKMAVYLALLKTLNPTNPD